MDKFNYCPKWLKQKIYSKQTGSSLIEIMIAAMVLAVVMIALISTLSYSVKSITESNNRAEAIRLAEEAMEIFERQRTLRGWQDFTQVDLAGSTTFCLTSLPDYGIDFHSAVEPQACGEGDEISQVQFVREAYISYVDADTIDIQLVVSWPNPKGSSPHKVNLETEFKRWE